MASENAAKAPSTPISRSPYAHLLLNNNPPTDVEIASLRPLVRKAEAQIAPLDAVIQKLEATLEQARARRVPLQAFLDAHRPILSLARCIPDDVLREIFTRVRVQCSRRELWRLRGVCSRWRRVSHDMPFLWREIEVTAKRLVDDVQLVRWQLERAKSVPLHFTLRFRPAEWEEDYRNTRDAFEILEALAPHSSRCENLHLSVDEEHIDEMADLGFAFPNVKSLWLMMPRLPALSTDIFATFSSLVELNIHVWIGILDTVLLSLPWSQLRVCKLGELSRYAISQILPLLAPDTALSLNMVHPYIGDNPPVSVESAIGTLSIRFTNPRFIDPFFETLHAPRLTKLAILEDRDQSRQQFDILAEFLQRSRCPLTHLVLFIKAHCPEAPFQDLMKCEALQKIEYLKLEFDDREEDETAEAILEFLADNPESAVPAVTWLEVASRRVVDDESLFAVCAARRKTLTKVGTQSHNLSGPPRMFTLEAIDQLRRDGLEVEHASYLPERW